MAFSIVALALIAVTAAALHFPVRVTDVELACPLERVPTVLGGWAATRSAPTEVLPLDTRAPHALTRTYQEGPDTVWVAVGYYPSQSEARRPAVRDMLFPSHGWSQLSERAFTIPLGAPGPPQLPANLVQMEIRGRRVAVLYWYETGGRSIASDHWYRGVLIVNRLLHGRTDGALVRVATPISADGPERALDSAARFLRAFYPALLRCLPARA